jgi:hypothetical protein
MQARTALALAFALAAIALSATADRLVTTDGRVIEVKKARVEGAGYRLTFEHGEIALADKAAVKAVEIEGDMSDYVPKDDTEKANLAKGFVKYGGAWMTKQAYENKLAEEHAKTKKRTDDLAAHADFDHGWTKDTAHFSLHTNSSAELLDYYGNLLETYYSLMDNRFGINPSPSLRRTKMVVNIYKNRKEFTKYTSSSPGVAGFFSPNDQTLNFYHDYDDPDISNWVSLHECTHLLTFLIDPQYVPQIWVNEAVADYFGSAEIVNDTKKGKITISPGRLQTERVLTVQQAIADKNDIKLEDLFKITRDEFEAFQYAHAWSFVYFLNQTPKYKKGFDKFFKDLYSLAKGITYENISYASFAGGRGKQVKPEEIRRVLLASLGVKDTETLEKEWKDFIAKVPIEGPSARFKRAYYMVWQGGMISDAKDEKVRSEQTRKNAQQALEDLDAAIAGGIKDARAYFARFQVRSLAPYLGIRPEKDPTEDLHADLAKAIELDPLNASFRFAMGNLMAKDVRYILMGGEGGGADSGDEQEKPHEVDPEVAALLGLAVELAPENESYLKRYESYVGKK